MDGLMSPRNPAQNRVLKNRVHDHGPVIVSLKEIA